MFEGWEKSVKMGEGVQNSLLKCDIIYKEITHAPENQETLLYNQYIKTETKLKRVSKKSKISIFFFLRSIRKTIM